MAKPTHEDAMLMLQMAQLGAVSGMRDATRFLWSDAFEQDYDEFVSKYPRGSQEYSYVSQICGWYETLGTFYKHKLFNEELLFDWLLVSGVWNRIKGFALGLREEMGEPKLYENFEAMAKAQM